MTNGRFQIRDQKLIVDDETRIAARGAKVVQRIWAQLDQEKWFT
jgi:hypothetical protein